jgi:uncharacterized protein (TIGR03086 family)
VVDLRAGGTYRWTVSPGHIAQGTFREVEPGRRIVFGWGWTGRDDLPADASTVTVTVEPDDRGGTLLTLTHTGLDELQAKAHAEGWTHYLDRLVRLATAGDAGPDEWAQAPENLTPMVAAEASLAAIQPVLRGLSAADDSLPTPCEQFTLRDLSEHLIASMAGLGAMAGTEVSRPEGVQLEEVVSVMADQVITAWRSVDLNGMVPVPGGGGGLPASVAAGLVPLELMLHGWDLAQVHGVRMDVSDRLADYVRDLAEAVVPGARGRAFADEVPAPDDASALDRLVAYTGRKPLTA